MPSLAHASDNVPQGEINTLLGKGSEFEGKLTFEGTVRIDGKISGEIFSEDVLVIGEGATVAAEISVGVVIVEGSVTGNIRAKRAVELHAPARVRGNIETPSLYIDKGVLFEGHCKMDVQPAARPANLAALAADAGKPPAAAAPKPEDKPAQPAAQATPPKK